MCCRIHVCILAWWYTLVYGKGFYVYIQYIPRNMHTVFALLCFVVVIHWLIFPFIRLTSLARASKATLMNMDKYFMWIHYERFHNHNKAKLNKTVCIFLGIYCIYTYVCVEENSSDIYDVYMTYILFYIKRMVMNFGQLNRVYTSLLP